MPWRHCIGQDFFFWISFLHDFLNLFKKNPDNFHKFVAKANIASLGGRSWTNSFCSQVSHHERALVNDLQSVSKKLSETRSRIGLKSMKINVGSQKTIQKKRYRQKRYRKKRYRKKRYTQTQPDNFHKFVAKVESIEQGYIKHMLWHQAARRFTQRVLGSATVPSGTRVACLLAW